MVSRRTNCFCGDIATQMVRSDRDWVYTVNDYPNAWRKLCWEESDASAMRLSIMPLTCQSLVQEFGCAASLVPISDSKR